MASDFHSDEAQPETKSPRTGAVIITGVASGLMVAMLLAVVVPRLFEDAAANWLVTLGAAVVTALVVIAIGRTRWRRASIDEAGSSGTPVSGGDT